MDPISLPIDGANFFSFPEARTVLERDILPKYMPETRWFGGKAREPQRIAIEALLPVSKSENAARLLLARVEYPAGEPELYVIPVQIGAAKEIEQTAIIAQFQDGYALVDALEDADCRADLLRLVRTEDKITSENGELIGIRGSALDPESDLETKSRYLKVEQSNSSISYGDTIFLKIFRKPDRGMNPDVEITRFLSEKAHYSNIPPFGGAIEYRQSGAEPRVLALGVGMVKNRGDAWAYALDEVGKFYQRLPPHDTPPDEAWVEQNLGECGERIAQLAVRTAEVHLALASDSSDPAFAPEPITMEDQRTISEGIQQSARDMFATLRGQKVEGSLQQEIDELIALEPRLEELAGEYAARDVHACKTRTHGDYHLGQVLYTGDDFVIIDFEGEPRRTLAERQAKRSPLRDVAGMLRSFHYAAHSGLERIDLADRHEVGLWGELWAAVASRIFKGTWLQTCKDACFIPADRGDVDRVLNAFLLEKAIYEVMYELNHRPTWVGIPIRGCLHILRPEEARNQEDEEEVGVY